MQKSVACHCLTTLYVIQAALSGRDVVGIAQTGSGKTAAFLLPMVVHCAAQARVRAGQGPIAIVIAPVRELAEQIHREARRFGATRLLHEQPLEVEPRFVHWQHF